MYLCCEIPSDLKHDLTNDHHISLQIARDITLVPLEIQFPSRRAHHIAFSLRFRGISICDSLFWTRKWPENDLPLAKCSSESDSSRQELSYTCGLAPVGAWGALLRTDPIRYLTKQIFHKNEKWKTLWLNCNEIKVWLALQGGNQILWSSLGSKRMISGGKQNVRRKTVLDICGGCEIYVWFVSYDILSKKTVKDISGDFTLLPYQSIWLTNKKF